MPADIPSLHVGGDELRELDRLYARLGAQADRVVAEPTAHLRRRVRQRRQRFVTLIVVMVLIVGAAAFGSLRFGRISVQPTTPMPKPTVDFIALRDVGDIAMDLGGEFDGGSLFQDSAIVDRVAYVVAWHWPGPLRVGALDLRSGQPRFPTIDLGQWQEVSEFHALAEGLVVLGTPVGESVQTVAVLDPATGAVRWQQPLEKQQPQDRPLRVLLAHAGVVAAGPWRSTTADIRSLDWVTGEQQWRVVLDARNVTIPQRWEPNPDGNDPFDAGPDDPRLLLPAQDSGDVTILNTRTGNTTSVHAWSQSPWDRATPTPIPGLHLIDNQLYIVDNGFAGATQTAPATLTRLVADGSGSPTVLWTGAPGQIVAESSPCGVQRLCLTVSGPAKSGDPVASGYGVRVLDATTGRDLGLFPNMAMSGGILLGDRYLDPKGRVYDLSAALLGDPTPYDVVQWLSAGSVLTLSYDVRAGLDSPQTGTVFGKSTMDGASLRLGQIPVDHGGVAMAGGYLVVPTPSGFHAWQFATG
jgi:hypothetical protein